MEKHVKELLTSLPKKVIQLISDRIRNLIGTGVQAKIAKGIFWSFLGTVISKGFVTIAFFYLARILSVDDYGKIGMLRSFITTFAFFSLASFGATVNKYIALLNGKSIKELSRIYSLTRGIVFILAFIIMTVIFIFPSFFAETIVGDSKMYLEVKISSFIIFFSAMNGFQNGALAGFENFKAISKVNIINGFISLPIIIILAYLYGVIGVVYALLIVYFLVWLSSAYFLQKEIKNNAVVFTVNFTKVEFKILWLFSFPAFLNSMMISPIVLWCNSLLVKGAPKGYEEMGFYSAAYSLSLLIMTLNTVIGDVFYPYAMKLFNTKNEQFGFYNILMPWFLGAFICMPLLIFPDLISFLYGSDYMNFQMYNTVIIVLIFTIIICQKQGISRNIAAANFMWLAVFDNVFWAVIAVVSCHFLVAYGAPGRALSFLIAYLINLFVFIPIYINKGLVNKNLVISKYNAAISMLILISIITFYFFGNFFWLRVFCLIFIFGTGLYVLYRWISKINITTRNV